MHDVSSAQVDYLNTLKKQKRIIRISRILVLLLFLGLWEAAASFGFIDAFIFSSPSRVSGTFYRMLLDKTIFLHAGITVLETLISFLLVIMIGILFAVILWLSSKAAEITEPFLVILNSLPKSALAPLLIVWLGANMRTIIVAGISVALFGTIINLYTSFRESDADKLKLIYTLGGTRKDALFKVVLPSNIPAIISNAKVNIGLSLVGVVIGEFIGARRGLGYLIIYSSQVFQLDTLIMAIVILCIIALLLYSFIGYIEKLYLKRL